MPIVRRSPYVTRISQLPSVPVSLDAQLRGFLESLKQAVEVGEGLRGDPLDTKLTVRDLQDLGVLEIQGGTLGLGSGVKNDLGPGEPGTIGEDGYPIVRDPFPVHGFTATGLFTRVVLSWDVVRYSNHDRTDIYRAEVKDFGQAVKIGSSTGVMYADVVGGGWSGYYWARNVSTQGVEGPVAGPAAAQTPTDPEYMIEILEGQLDESALVQALRDRIDLIDNDSLPGSVGQRLQDLNDYVQSQLDSIEATLAELENVPEFDANQDWNTDSLVSYEGALYRALQDMTAPSPLPTDDLYWEKIGNYASLGDAVAAHAAQLEDHSTRITDTESGVQANAQSVSLLQAAVSDVEQDLTTKAAISYVDSAIADEEEARASAITSLDTHLQSQIDAKAAITYVDDAISTEELARATAISTLETELQDQIDTKAAITYVDDAVSSEASARATAISTLETNLQGQIDTKAAITYVDDAVSNESDARATAISQLQAEVDGHSAAIEQKAEASVVDDLEGDVTQIQAQWTIKTDVNGNVAGIGLMNDGATSLFAVVADKFAITSPNGDSESSPFFHLSDGQTVNGVWLPAGTYFNTAFIGDATITDAKIGSLGVDKITGDTATFVSANIENGSITNAKIGNFIQSNNWPSAGWHLNKSGSFTLKSGSTGARLEQTPTRIDVFDGTRLRVRLGQL